MNSAMLRMPEADLQSGCGSGRKRPLHSMHKAGVGRMHQPWSQMLMPPQLQEIHGTPQEIITDSQMNGGQAACQRVIFAHQTRQRVGNRTKSSTIWFAAAR